MPPKRANIGRKQRATRQQANTRSNETAEESAQRNESVRLQVQRLRENETDELRASRLEDLRDNTRRSRNIAYDNNRHLELIDARDQRQTHRTRNIASFSREAFNYNHEIDYASHPFVVIGPMDKVCSHCNALKYKNETPGMCCASGKVKLPQLNPPPEPLSTLVSGLLII